MIAWINLLGEKLERFAPLVLRIGLAIVFLLFAYHKLHLATNGQGVSEIRQLFDVGISSAAALNYYVGLLELVVSVLLIGGWQVRIAGLVASGMTFFIFFSYFQKYGITIQPDLYRDVGLSAAGLALFMLGSGKGKNISPIP